jgi:alkylation response protein AidB-like acyl-CoA dehydrogenase
MTSLTALDRAKKLAPVVMSEADACQEIHQLTDTVTQALQDSGLFWMNVPTELGGEDIHPLERVQVIEELSRADTSIGWTFMALAGYMGYVSTGCGDDAVKDIFSDPTVKIAGMANPVGQIIDQGADSYRVQGTYRFGSGVPQAKWIAAGGTVEGGANNGKSVCTVVPVTKVELQGDWDPIGLIGTGSINYQVLEQDVPKSYSFNVEQFEAQRGGPAGYMDFFSTAMIYHTAVALGAVKRSLEEIVTIADSGKRRPGADLMVDQQLFRHEFARHEASFRSARAYIVELANEAVEIAERGDKLTGVQAARFRQAAALTHRVGMDAIEFAYFWGGSASLRKPTVLGRCMLDMHALNNHLLVDHSNFADTAPAIIGDYR